MTLGYFLQMGAAFIIINLVLLGGLRMLYNVMD